MLSRISQRATALSKTDNSDNPDTHARKGKYHGGGRARKLDVQSIKTALESVGGLKTAAAMKLGVARSTLYKYFDEHPELHAFCNEIEDNTKDMAEGQVLKAIKSGDMGTVRWYLDRKAKERGYGNITVEATGPNGGPIQTESVGEDASFYKHLTTEELLEIQRLRTVADERAKQSRANGET